MILSFLIAAAAALFAALSYAEFAVELPVTGGAFNYMSVTFGEAVAWSVAWNMILETLLSSAAVARGFSGYLATLVGAAPSALLVPAGPFELDFLAAGLIAALTGVLSHGTKQSSTFNIAVCCVNLSCIAFILAAGLPKADLANAAPFFPYGGRGTFAAASIVFFAFVGFDYLANAAEEVADPARDLPIGILTSLGVATALYALMATTMVLLVPYTQVDVHAPFSAAFAARGMPWAAKIVSCGAVAGIVTSTMTGLMAQARLFVVLGRERLLPGDLAAVHPGTNVPLVATLVTGGAAAALAALLDINVLAELVSVGTLYVFYAVCAGVYFRRCHLPGTTAPGPALARLGALTAASVALSVGYTYAAPWQALTLLGVCWAAAAGGAATLPCVRPPARFGVPLFPATSILGILFTIHLLCSLGWPAYVRFVVWMALGAVLYCLYGARAAERAEAEAKARRDTSAGGELGVELASLEHEGPMGAREYEIHGDGQQTSGGGGGEARWLLGGGKDPPT